MPYTKKLLYQTEKKQPPEVFYKMLLLKIVQYSRENARMKFLRTSL